MGIKGKIEKVPRGIRGEKSSKDMASSRNSVSTIGALASPKMVMFLCIIHCYKKKKLNDCSPSDRLFPLHVVVFGEYKYISKGHIGSLGGGTM